MKVGCGISSDQIPEYRQQLLQLPVVEIEDFLNPGFADQAQGLLPQIKENLAGYEGEVVISGPYIDLNPGSPDPLVLEVVCKRFGQVHALAAALGATEIIFLFLTRTRCFSISGVGE